MIESSSFSQWKKEEEKREIFACSAISQLASIVLDLLGIKNKITIGPGHVFNSILLNHGLVLFADFSNEVFEIVNLGVFYTTEGKYQALKKDKRLSTGQILDINKAWEKGFLPKTLKEILNLKLYSYVFIADNTAATAILYTNRGNDYEFAGEFNKAMDNYAQALKINPNIAGVYCNRGFAYANNGDLTRAIADYNKAIEINPNDEDAYNDRALAYKNKENFFQAISDYDKALAINPSSVQIYNNRGNVFSLQGNLAQGIQDYTKAIEIDPENAMSYINRAACYYYLKDYNKAWDDVHQAEELGGTVNSEFINKLRKCSVALKVQ